MEGNIYVEIVSLNENKSDTRKKRYVHRWVNFTFEHLEYEMNVPVTPKKGKIRTPSGNFVSFSIKERRNYFLSDKISEIAVKSRSERLSRKPLIVGANNSQQQLKFDRQSLK